MIPLDDIDGPPLSPHDDTIPQMACPRCSVMMDYNPEQNRWECAEGDEETRCGGFVADDDEGWEEDR